MTVSTLTQVDEAQREAAIARKQMEEAIENYAQASHFHVEALRVHNETD